MLPHSVNWRVVEEKCNIHLARVNCTNDGTVSLLSNKGPLAIGSFVIERTAMVIVRESGEAWSLRVFEEEADMHGREWRLVAQALRYETM